MLVLCLMVLLASEGQVIQNAPDTLGVMFLVSLLLMGWCGVSGYGAAYMDDIIKRETTLPFYEADGVQFVVDGHRYINLNRRFEKVINVDLTEIKKVEYEGKYSLGLYMEKASEIIIVNKQVESHE